MFKAKRRVKNNCQKCFRMSMDSGRFRPRWSYLSGQKYLSSLNWHSTTVNLMTDHLTVILTSQIALSRSKPFCSLILGAPSAPCISHLFAWECLLKHAQNQWLWRQCVGPILVVYCWLPWESGTHSSLHAHTYAHKHKQTHTSNDGFDEWSCNWQNTQLHWNRHNCDISVHDAIASNVSMWWYFDIWLDLPTSGNRRNSLNLQKLPYKYTAWEWDSREGRVVRVIEGCISV